MLEKEIQSDRLDDSTRYLRYSAGSSSLSSNYTPHRDRISNLRYSASPMSSKSTTTSPSPSQSVSVSASASAPGSTGAAANGESKSQSPSELVKTNTNGSVSSRSTSKSKLSPPKAIRLNSSRQSSVENLANKPPAAPSKAESPTKTVNSSTSSNSVVKWPNKDFRKSSLNVGPTDRPRKSRTPSSGAESEDVANGGQLERSPSAGSESSLTSATASGSGSGTGTGSPSAGSNKKVSTKPPNRQLKAHKSCAPTPNAIDTASSTANTASSSASESEQRGKTTKKQSKKKTTTRTGDAAGQLINQNSHSGQHTHTDSRSVENSLPASQSRLQKLSSVSNFFATRQQDANSEPIFLESSDSSGEVETLGGPTISLMTDIQTNETRTTPSSETTTTTTNPSLKSITNNTLSSTTRCPRETTSTQDTQATESQGQTTYTSEQDPDQEEPSWWQDTSLQINTASALDYNNRGDMPYRLRHIDSGEDHAWWLRPDEEDDTLAEETLNQLDDEPEPSTEGNGKLIAMA
ncbi:uncharacterized protein Dwil_GK26907 [Drosophila willistoni]|uniref:Uncharacterized protein n=1 Tax=Drosophila willistoni TaxID=7260 RepID=A0A0Q9X1B9_DROWI|nr:uncharacterized protein Dwil_GK26907 [Drosophila willistoni]